MTGRPVVIAPLRVEAASLRGAVGEARVVRGGMGPARARWTAAQVAMGSPSSVAVAGMAGALSPELRPGDVVVASDVRTPGGTSYRCSTGPLVAALRAAGIEPYVGPIVSTEHLRLPRAERAWLAASGALAVDMESAWIAPAVGGLPFAVVRTIVDTPGRPLWRPVASAIGGIRALLSLRRAGPALASWAAAAGPRTVLLAGPRSFCAGVERAIEIVERALDRYGPPVYVRKQIVHNVHVVRDLEGRGAIFVDEIDQVPEGALTVFSAHGVSPAVRRMAAERRLQVIDATCPLVTKVHTEARRFARNGYTIVLVGHEGHEEVEGTTGEAPEAIRLIESADEVNALKLDRDQPVAYLTQTTLAVDEVEDVVTALRGRFPALAGPGSDDICYATSNRQDAVRAIATECDLMLVIGSANSSNSRRLVEVSERVGCPARLLDDETGLDPSWLTDARTVGITAGASAPEGLVERVVSALAGLGPVRVEERGIVEESVEFTLPAALRGAR